jgi:hypothetical protein
MKAKADTIQEAKAYAKQAGQFADLYFNRVLGGIMLSVDAELFEYKGKCLGLPALLDFLNSGIVKHPLQSSVLEAMQAAKAEGMPIDMLTVFGRIQNPSTQTAHQLSSMMARVVHNQHVLVWAMLGYEFRVCSDLIGLVCTSAINASTLQAVEDIAQEMINAILGLEDRLTAFEQCCVFVEKYLLGLPFGQDVSELYAKHLERISNLKNSQS